VLIIASMVARAVSLEPQPLPRIRDTEPSPPPDEEMTELELFATGVTRCDLSEVGLSERLIFGWPTR
jgi:hypothetical protein